MSRFLFILLSLFFCTNVSAEEVKYVAVLDFTGASIPPQLLKSTSDAAREGALDMLPPDKFTLMTRESTKAILDDMGVDISCIDGSCETETLRNIHADYGVTGSITQIDDQYELVIRLFESKSSKLLASETQNFNSHAEMRKSTKQMTKLLVANIPGAGLGTSISFADITVKRAKIYRGEDIVNQPSDKLGFLIIKSNPAGANILLNGESIGIAPLQKAVPEGQYVVIGDMGAIYHEATSGVIEVKDGQAHEIPLKLQPSYGHLRIDSNPKGAKVYISNEFVGITPYKQEQHPSGVFNLRVEMENYFSYQERIIIDDLQKSERDIKLDKYLSNLRIDSSPSGADIWLNGVPTGKQTPFTFGNKPPGLYEVRLVKNKYKTLDTTIAINAGEDSDYAPELEGNFGQLLISSAPTGAKIILNGVLTEYTTPYAFNEQNAGLTIVELQKDGYGFEREQINIPADGSPVQVHKELSAKLGTVLITSTTPSGEPCIGDAYLDEKHLGKTPLKTQTIANEHKISVDCEGMKGFQFFELKHNETLELNVQTQNVSKQDIRETRKKFSRAIWIDAGLLSLSGAYAAQAEINYQRMRHSHSSAMRISSPSKGYEYSGYIDDSKYYQRSTNRNILFSSGFFVLAATHYWFRTRKHQQELKHLKETRKQN